MDSKNAQKYMEAMLRAKKERIDGLKARKIVNPFIYVEREKLEKLLMKVKGKIYTKVGELSAKVYVRSEPFSFEDRKGGTQAPISKYEPWGSLFDCGWFNFTGEVPQKADGKKLVAVIDISGEGLVVDNNGNPVIAITTFSADFDCSLGLPDKKYIPLFDSAKAGSKINFWVDGAANDLFGRLPNSGCVIEKNIAIENENIKKLYYDMQTLLSLFDNTADKETYEILGLIKKLAPRIRKVREDNALEICEELKPWLEKKNDEGAFEYTATGHAHLDLAWLWPLRESKRKGARTFSTQLYFMEKYPEYKFGASQAQLYKWVEKGYPVLFERVLDKIKEGRWDVQGSTWVEPDTNLIGGESMFRQFIYGKKYFKEKFDIEGKVFFIPDSFGYSGCLPQVMKQCGVDYFLTQKMSWNTVNKFPYHTFNWKGIDGSEVLAHMLPENTYNSPMRAEKLQFGLKNYTAKDYCNQALSLYGIGDGGAGPSEEHIERAMRFKDLKYLPKVKHGKTIELFESIAPNKDKYPTYEGELYLERHRGTYTTQAANKRYNRKTELLLREYESLASRVKNPPIDKTELEEIWKEVLLYQFHDILPGSSIKRVYDESKEHYQQIDDKLQQAINDTAGMLYQGNSVYNSLNWDRKYFYEEDGRAYALTIPAFSAENKANAVELSNVTLTDDNGIALENEFISVKFDKNGDIVSFIDKKENFEYIQQGKVANKFTLYDDKGDCWDILPWDYKASDKVFQPELVKTETKVEKGVVHVTYTYEIDKSILTQTVTLFADENILRFDNKATYNETGKMLRVAFPLSIKNDTCKFNLQYGHIARRTTHANSIETAQFEVSGQKFVDYSDGVHALTLINDCKYGYKCWDNVIDMNLIRSPMFPGKDADKGDHVFSYALMAHTGEINSDVYHKAYEFNITPTVIDSSSVDDNAKLDIAIDNDNVIVDFIKQTFDGNDLVIRVFNSSEKEEKATVKAFGAMSIIDPVTEQDIEKFSGETTFKPFEVKNIKIKKN